jgi:hypothetical protein
MRLKCDARRTDLDRFLRDASWHMPHTYQISCITHIAHMTSSTGMQTKNTVRSQGTLGPFHLIFFQEVVPMTPIKAWIPMRTCHVLKLLQVLQRLRNCFKNKSRHGGEGSPSIGGGKPKGAAGKLLSVWCLCTSFFAAKGRASSECNTKKEVHASHSCTLNWN